MDILKKEDIDFSYRETKINTIVYEVVLILNMVLVKRC